jgi:glutamyl-Q tRNA(Asp) synthetase
MPSTRFAPSPTGFLHLGHAASAIFAREAAQGGRFLLRIEDIDLTRCREEFVAAIFEDLAWLGLSWEKPVRRQSEHFAEYGQELGRLDEMGILYPCFCTRKEILREIAAAGQAPHGPDGPLYPGTCRNLSKEEKAGKMASGLPYALRLDMGKAQQQAGTLFWHDRTKGRQQAHPEIFGDVILARKETPTSYHLAVTMDDHLQEIELVTRGEDLFPSTHVHRLLQALLGYATPEYHHHPLLCDASGKRLAKRDNAPPLRDLRQAGRSAGEILEILDKRNK